MSTTLSAIKARIRVVLEAATPTTALASDLFRSCPNTSQLLREWVTDNAGDQCLRKFDLRRVGDSAEREPFGGGGAGDEIQRDELLLLTVAYPRLERLYGDDGLDDMEDVIRGDARQIRDLITSGSTSVAVSGWQGVLHTVIHEPERDGAVWFQTLTFSVSYCEAQTLT
jgi:hypothetical protein